MRDSLLKLILLSFFVFGANASDSDIPITKAEALIQYNKLEKTTEEHFDRLIESEKKHLENLENAFELADSMSDGPQKDLAIMLVESKLELFDIAQEKRKNEQKEASEKLKEYKGLIDEAFPLNKTALKGHSDRERTGEFTLKYSDEVASENIDAAKNFLISGAFSTYLGHSTLKEIKKGPPEKTSFMRKSEKVMGGYSRLIKYLGISLLVDGGMRIYDTYDGDDEINEAPLLSAVVNVGRKVTGKEAPIVAEKESDSALID